MRISIIHPSRNRPEMALKTAKNWINRAVRQNYLEYIFSIDTSDKDKGRYHSLLSELSGDRRCLFGNNNSAIEAINSAAKICSGDLIIVVSDDFDCEQSWDDKLRFSLMGKSDFIVKTDDGLQPTLITLPIMDRVYYERFGYIYQPEYLHMHCDEEMTCVGHMLGKVLNVPIKFHHLHYTTGAMQKDAINIKNDATWGHGQATLDRRKKFNFGLKDEEIVMRHQDIKWR